MSEREPPTSECESGASARKAHERKHGCGGSAAEPPTSECESGASDRGQLVLVAAGVVAVALLPVVLAYSQLGYTGIATTEPSATTPERDAVNALERAAFAAAADEQGASSWANRSSVAATVAARFDDRAAAIETSDLQGARIHQVERNQTAATTWAAERCPDGPDRQFGPCSAAGGVVLQERAGETHVLAVAVDHRTVTEDGIYRGEYVLDAELGAGRQSPTTAQLGADAPP